MKKLNRIMSLILFVLGMYAIFFQTEDKYLGVICMTASIAFENRADIL